MDKGLGITSTVSEKSTVLDLYADIFSRRLGEAGGVLPVTDIECLWLEPGRGYGNIISRGVEGFDGTEGARALASACCFIKSDVSMSETEMACDRLCIWPLTPETGGPVGLRSCFKGLELISCAPSAWPPTNSLPALL